jgi:pimeloyl-ACP methyl ester carboxylesterase
MGSLFPLELISALFTNTAQWPGSGEPDDPAVHQFAAGAGWLLAETPVAHALERERGAALLDEIGPAILITASAGSPMGWLTADARPSLVKAIVALEPVGPPFFANPDLPISLDFGLTAAPMTFESLAEVPIAIVESEASVLAESCPATATFLEQSGCKVDRIVLAEHGVHGNGHLMMLERNNREVLEPILRWLDDTVT